MRKRIIGSIFLLAAVLLLLYASILGGAQQGQGQFQPVVGQSGKDVIWVPTPEDLIEQMLDMAKVTPNDYVIDLGSGDGRIVIAAAKRGARATGVEFNPDMVELSKSNAQKEGVAGKATFLNADIFETDFSQATVITMYLLPDLNMRLRPKILEMKPGTRVVSHAFTMEDWEADQTATVGGRSAYFWIVPAKVAGTWTTQGGKLTLLQSFQKIGGRLIINGQDQPLKNAKLEGDKISFVADGTLYSARVTGNTMVGTRKAGNDPEAKWTAER